MTETDTKAGFCSNCRESKCSLCMSPTCTCSDGRKHRNRPDFGKVPMHQPNRPKKGNLGPLKLADTKPRAKPKAPEVVWELVKAEPPAPPPRPKKKSVAEHMRPLLEQLAAEKNRDSHRLAVFPTTRGASFARVAALKVYSPKEWAFTASKLPETDQSALYVRWIGDQDHQL